jgi:hypothetical protein
MTTKQTGQRSFSRLWFVLAGVVGLLLLYILCIPNFVGSGTSKMNAILNNLRQLDGAKQQWALDHGRTGAVVVTTQDIAPYLPHFTTVAGERYILRTLAEVAEAQLTREVDGRPKGTVLRFGTNDSIEIVGPNQMQRTRQ